jgi:prevent-host-death family protein
MLTDSIISMTDLRIHTKSVVQKLNKRGSSIVVANNKPLFVIVSPEQRDAIHKPHFSLESIPSDISEHITNTTEHQKLMSTIHQTF